MEVGRTPSARLFALGLTAWAVFAAPGCGSSPPSHEVKPLTARPPTQDFTKLTTPEEKIRFIEGSKAPESEKQKAIEQVRAGRL